jgi:hypothetical protein
VELAPVFAALAAPESGLGKADAPGGGGNWLAPAPIWLTPPFFPRMELMSPLSPPPMSPLAAFGRKPLDPKTPLSMLETPPLIELTPLAVLEGISEVL